MLKSYYIHTVNGQSSLAELCDKDGNVIAEIMPKGSEVHRQAVIELLQGWIECAQTMDTIQMHLEGHHE